MSLGGGGCSEPLHSSLGDEIETPSQKNEERKPRNWHWYNPQGLVRFHQLYMHSFVCVCSSMKFYNMCSFV